MGAENCHFYGNTVRGRGLLFILHNPDYDAFISRNNSIRDNIFVSTGHLHYSDCTGSGIEPASWDGVVMIADSENNSILNNSISYELESPDEQTSGIFIRSGSGNTFTSNRLEVPDPWARPFFNFVTPTAAPPLPSLNALGVYYVDSGSASPVLCGSSSWIANDSPQFSTKYQCSAHPADLDQSCDIDIGELVSYIGLWQADSTAYPMRVMMDAVGKWKSGTAC
jgi:hypothetical protein